MSQTLRTRPTSRGILPDARHVVLPEGIVATGFPSIDATCRQIGIVFDPWQAELNRAILGKDADGLYAADTVALSIPRQAGKTYDIGGLVFADSIKHPGTTTVWTAHRFKVARESFNEMRGWARSSKLASHIDYDDITTAAGNECIPFRNGSRILFAARERGAIRGFTKVRRLVLDEAQILTEAAMADLAPTQNQATNPQIILMGTPPKPTDPSEVWMGLRDEALEGRSEGLLWVEFSADEDADPDDREQWAKANPSFPQRTSEKAILRLKKLLTPDDFKREALGIWPDTSVKSAIDQRKWASLNHLEDERPTDIALAVEVTPDRAWSMIGLAGRRSDGNIHIQIVESARGTKWVTERVADLVEAWHPAGVGVNPNGPAGALISDLSAAGVEPMLISGREQGQACGALFDAISEGTIRHQAQPLLNIAVRAAGKQPKGETWVWRSNENGTDISPLNAVTLAHHVLTRPNGKKRRSGVVV